MALCMGKPCAHLDESTNQCTFAGACIVKKYNLNQQQVPESIETVKEPATEQFVFNPFQRGNGCVLGGYTVAEIYAKVR